MAGRSQSVFCAFDVADLEINPTGALLSEDFA
jgi:hypothetical protein